MKIMFGWKNWEGSLLGMGKVKKRKYNKITIMPFMQINII